MNLIVPYWQIEPEITILFVNIVIIRGIKSVLEFERFIDGMQS